jgi:hypothetical protein
MGHSMGRALAQDTEGSDKQITFNKATSLHDVVYKRRKPTQTDRRNIGLVLSHIQRGAAGEALYEWKDPFHARKLQRRSMWNRKSLTFTYDVCSLCQDGVGYRGFRRNNPSIET